MGRRETVWGARHIKEEEEIKRIMKEYTEQFGVQITKLEASAIAAMRSQEMFWNHKKAKEAISKLRGIE